MAIIEVEHLTKTYKTYQRGSGFRDTIRSFFKRNPILVRAVDDVSFSIPEGEICGILGPNGAGKSTTIKMLCGALYPTSGSIQVLGYTPSKDRKRYVQEIGAVFGQKSQLIWDIPPIDSFRMNQAIYGISDADFKARLSELAEMFEVEGIMEKPTRVLSLGERMKCEFIMAMLHRPKIVFLDEPTIGLDVIAKSRIRSFIAAMKQQGTTFLLTTHDLEDVEQLADRVLIINHGQKVFDDTLPKLRMNLGEKKIVELVLAEPMSMYGIPNARLLEQKSDLELTLEVDVSKRSIGEFIEQITKRLRISDISVKELPMDQIITRIYESK